MRSSEWILIQYDWCPQKKGGNGHRDIHSQRENDVKTHRRWPGDWSSKYIYKPRNTRDSQKLDKEGRILP